MRYKKPNFNDEWEEALRYREFQKMGKKMWIHIATTSYFITSYSKIKDVLNNIDLDYENLESDKKERFEEAFESGVIEIPLVVKFSDDDYDLLGGNTRTAGLIKNGIDPKFWVIDMSKKSGGNPSKMEMDEKWSEKYKRSIDCNNPKGFSQRAHCQGKKKKMNENEKLIGGLADNKSLIQIAKRHDAKNYYHIDDMVKSLKKQLEVGMKVEMEHTDDKEKAKEIALDHLYEDPKYYSKLSKIEEGENSHEHDDDMVTGVAEILKQIKDKDNRKKVYNNMIDKFDKEDVNFSKKEFSKLSAVKDIDETDTGSSGSFEGPAFAGTIKRKIKSIPNANLSEQEEEIEEVTTSASSGAYDVPAFGRTPKGGRKDPLKVDGPDSIYKGRAVKDKKFPKWGGPGGVFVKVKEKCKKFPYCNQGNTGAIEFIKEDEEIQNAINEVSKNTGIPKNEIQKIVLNEIKQIFI